MRDNGSCHKAPLITDWIDENNVNCTTWQAKSPDLKNLRDCLVRKLEKCQQQLSLDYETP